MWKNNLASVSLVECGGFNGCIMKTINFARRLWTTKIELKIGVVNDEDKDYAYKKIKPRLKRFINNNRRVPPNNKPTVTYDDNNYRINISMKHRNDIIIWNRVIPVSLEHQMKISLQAQYPSLKKYNDEEEIFKQAKIMLNCDTENLVKHCVQMFHNKLWYSIFYSSIPIP